MVGYICIAMLEDPPYNMILGATEEEPEDWLEGLPLPSHLLCYQSFKETKVILKQFIQRLKVDGIIVKADKAFSAPSHQVMRAFIEVRDEAVINDQLVKDMDDDYDEGARLYDLGWEYDQGSNKIIPDLKKAFKWYMQAAELGYSPAYFSLALAYFHGNGVKKDLNESLKWAMREIESSGIYGYYVAADCFVEAGMKEQASDMWRRCFKELIHEDLPNVLGAYARHASEGLVEQVHTKKIARLFGIVAKKESDRKAYIWLWENQVTDSDFDDIDEDVNETEQGNAEAQFELGQMYKLGSGVEVDNKQAVYWYRKAAIQGNPAAQFELGQMYYNDPRGGGGREDDEQWIYWYRKAAEQGNPAAQFEVGQWYRYDEDEKAVFWYRKAAEQGNPRAQHELGRMYCIGKGVEEDAEQSVFWYRKAAEQGDAEAQYLLGDSFDDIDETEQGDAEAQFELGQMYKLGSGVEVDNKQAVYWYRKAAIQGNPAAQFELGLMYYIGEGVEEDDEQAVFWYRKAAEQGNPRAQNELGLMYYIGEGVEEDSEQAVFWYRKAAEQGDAKAQCFLGDSYNGGDGVEEDDEQAVFWYRKAAEQDYAEAQDWLGHMYEFGSVVEKDAEQAVFWYRKAAEQGYWSAQSQLGKMYQLGHIVEQDDGQAIFWYRKASEQGNTDAQEALTGLGVDWDNS